ncbi:protein FAM228A isoform X2 [Embiotoca jacksoni]|uniref:protein FAM228A isoform X2 n=1 Tax=Embiotoca jacksoni TaxID=100190 RepID=UPI003704D44C
MATENLPDGRTPRGGLSPPPSLFHCLCWKGNKKKKKKKVSSRKCVLYVTQKPRKLVYFASFFFCFFCFCFPHELLDKRPQINTVMSHVTKSSGVITVHTPFPVSLLKTGEWIADEEVVTESRKSLSQPSGRTRNTCRRARAGKRNEASLCRPKRSLKRDRLSHTSLRHLQVKLEAENQQAQEIIQQILDTENSFIKLESFLNHWDFTKLRRRELFHKRWTEHVWLPLQRRVDAHVSDCSPLEAKRRQRSYSHYLHHCNAKGFVFLDTYNLNEYNPFILNIKKQQYLKLKTAELRNPLCLRFHEKMKEKRTSPSYEAGCKYTRRKVLQSDGPLCEASMPQADRLPEASSNRHVSGSIKVPAEDDTE